MKSIKLKNNLIGVVYEFLTEVKLVGRASRGRSQFLKRLEEKDKEIVEFATEIRKKYFKVDESGDFIIENKQFIPKENVSGEDLDTLGQELGELETDTFEISFGEHSKQYEAMFEALDVIEEEMAGKVAYAYDELMIAYEENEEEL